MPESTSLCIFQAIIGAELQALYAALRAKRPSELPPLAIQYYDFAAWQRGRLEGGELAGSIEYWKQQLRGVPVLELPTDRPYPVGGLSSKGGGVPVVVPPRTAAALRKLTSACGTTLFTVMLAAWKVQSLS